MAEHDGLSAAPVLVLDLGAVAGLDRRHASVLSFGRRERPGKGMPWVIRYRRLISRGVCWTSLFNSAVVRHQSHKKRIEETGTAPLRGFQLAS
jgi:hypothetical protein